MVNSVTAKRKSHLMFRAWRCHVRQNKEKDKLSGYSGKLKKSGSVVIHITLITPITLMTLAFYL